jgi:hypothetical protein
MEGADGFDVMADACIANNRAILNHGSCEMQALSRLLLHALAAEILRREIAPAPSHPNPSMPAPKGRQDV